MIQNMILKNFISWKKIKPKGTAFAIYFHPSYSDFIFHIPFFYWKEIGKHFFANIKNDLAIFKSGFLVVCLCKRVLRCAGAAMALY